MRNTPEKNTELDKKHLNDGLRMHLPVPTSLGGLHGVGRPRWLGHTVVEKEAQSDRNTYKHRQNEAD